MDKLEIYENFLKSLRVAITNSSVYFKGHPIFTKAVEDLMGNIREMSTVLKPLKIGITSNYLMFGDEKMSTTSLHHESAKFFHMRKIKSIEIKESVSNEELAKFLSQANLSPKNIFMSGGLSAILKKEGVSNIIVSGLDYSELLKGEGEEQKDIWLYLLKSVVDDGDIEKIGQLVDNSAKALEKIRANDLLGDAKIKGAIDKFLGYLKANDINKYHEFSKGLATSIFRSPDVSDTNKIDKLKEFLKGLRSKDITDILMGQFEVSSAASPLSLNLFSKLIDKNMHKEVASSLAQEVGKRKDIKNNPEMVAGLKSLFSLPASEHVSQIYSNNLSSILKSISLTKGVHFDKVHLRKCYWLVILELFILENSQNRITVVMDNIISEIDNNPLEEKLHYIKDLSGALAKKRKLSPHLEHEFQVLDICIAGVVENYVFTDSEFPDFDYFLNIIKSSNFDTNFYLDKIFNNDRVNSYVLKLFFKFFPREVLAFRERLSSKINDISFLKKLMESLKSIDPEISSGILKQIFSAPNDLIKIEVLEILQKVIKGNEEFMFAVLKRQNLFQRKQAYLGIVKNLSLRKRLAESLLVISNPLGLRTKLILENIGFVMEHPFLEAKECLINLGKYGFFWNKSVRNKAKQALSKL